MVRPTLAMPTRLALAALVAVSGCRDLPGETRGAAGEAPVTDAHELLVFVFDRSSSMKRHELEHARELTRDRLRDLDYGDRIVAMEMLHHALDEEPVRWAQRVPLPEFADHTFPGDSVSKARFIRDASDYVARFSEPSGRDDIDGTDILSTMHLVASELRGDPDAVASLFLFSDMLQVSGELNMERGDAARGEGWIALQDSLGTLPDLTGLCVAVIGALEDTGAARRVHDFWAAYFDATGATLREADYAYRPVRLPRGGCG